jgi:ketosteroid isomerase-like protein
LSLSRDDHDGLALVDATGAERWFVRADDVSLDPGVALVGDELVFTSPQDDHIDRQAFFDRCFPTADRVARQELLHVVPAGDGDVFIAYEYELKDGGTYRNTELISVAEGRITEIQVFFGGAVR